MPKIIPSNLCLYSEIFRGYGSFKVTKREPFDRSYKTFY